MNFGAFLTSWNFKMASTRRGCSQPSIFQIVVAASELELSTKRDLRGRGRERRKIEGPLFSRSPLPTHTPSRSALAFSLSRFALAVSVSVEKREAVNSIPFPLTKHYIFLILFKDVKGGRG